MVKPYARVFGAVIAVCSPNPTSSSSQAHGLLHFPDFFAVGFGHVTTTTMQCGHNDVHHFQAWPIATLHADPVFLSA